MDNFDELMIFAEVYVEQKVLDRPSLRVMRCRNGTLSGSDLAHEPRVGSTKTYQPEEMPLPTMPRPDMMSRHQAFQQEMSSEAVSSSSQLKAALPVTRAKVERRSTDK